MMIAQPVVIPDEVEHHRLMQKPIEHGGGNSRVTEDLTSFPDVAVGGHDDRGFQIALRNNLKQRRRRLTEQRKVTEFVDHQQGWSGVEPNRLRPLPLDRGAMTASGEIGRVVK